MDQPDTSYCWSLGAWNKRLGKRLLRRWAATGETSIMYIRKREWRWRKVKLSNVWVRLFEKPVCWQGRLRFVRSGRWQASSEFHGRPLRGLYGNAARSMKWMAKKVATTNILTMGCCIKLLLMCLTHWSRTRITSWKNGRSGYEAAMGWCDTRRGQFIDIIANAGRIDDFDIDLYFAIV